MSLKRETSGPIQTKDDRLGALPCVLLIGGASGTGKTTVAAEIGRKFGVPWLQVDNLRLSLQHSKVTLPEHTEDLYFFSDIEERPHLWHEPPEQLCQQLIAVGEIMMPAIEIVIANHVTQREPIVIEGDGILPSIVHRPVLKPWIVTGQLRSAFIHESVEDALLANMLARNRGIQNMSTAELRREAKTKWLFSQYVKAEAEQIGLPVIDSRPWTNLADRILEAI